MKKIVLIIIILVIIKSTIYATNEDLIVLNIMNDTNSTKEYLIYDLNKDKFKNLKQIIDIEGVESNYCNVKELEKYIIKNNIKEDQEILITKKTNFQIKLEKSKYFFMEKNKKSVSFFISNVNGKIVNIYPKFITKEEVNIKDNPQDEMKEDLDFSEEKCDSYCDFNKNEKTNKDSLDETNLYKDNINLPKTGTSSLFKLLKVIGFVILILAILMLNNN